MRDVTDNRTGELDVEAKRGRGRPPKADAMSNAERQAAFRARKRAERVSPMHRAVVDEQGLQDVAELEDQMAELRAELDATKAELAEAHETIDELNDELIPLRVAVDRLNFEVADQDRLLSQAINERDVARNAAKTVTVGGNGNPVDFDYMVELVDRVRKARTWQQRHAISELPGWERFTVRALPGMRNALWNAMTGDKLPVTKDA